MKIARFLGCFAIKTNYFYHKQLISVSLGLAVRAYPQLRLLLVRLESEFHRFTNLATTWCSGYRFCLVIGGYLLVMSREPHQRLPLFPLARNFTLIA